MAGRNFGAGSSRQQAVDCFRALGVAAIVAESFGAIYKRNAINSGLPILSLPALAESPDAFETGDQLTIDLERELFVSTTSVGHGCVDDEQSWVFEASRKPKPLQMLRTPLGELKENEAGVDTREKPHSG